MTYKRGDKVKIRPEWLDEGESPNEVYIVREDSNERTVLITPVSCYDLPIPPVQTVRPDTVMPCES